MDQLGFFGGVVVLNTTCLQCDKNTNWQLTIVKRLADYEQISQKLLTVCHIG